MRNEKNKTVLKKMLLTCLVLLILCGLGVGSYAIALSSTSSGYQKKFLEKGQTFGSVRYSATPGTGTNRIHFLNTGGSDAILLESDGHFALVDAAEDNDNPRNFSGLELKGYEDFVVSYLKKVAGNESGKVHLDFVVGTHAHSDHIGGFDTLILDPDITVGHAYLKTYVEANITDYEVKNWDNQEVYDQMLAACAARGVPVVSEITDTDIALGSFTVNILNGEADTSGEKKGENENALGVLARIGTFKAFLAADINKWDGDEKRLAPIIGKVDLLKLGHHGLSGSSSTPFLRTLNPDIAVITGHGAHYTVKHNVTFLAKAPIVTTAALEGIIAEFTNTEILIYSAKDIS